MFPLVEFILKIVEIYIKMLEFILRCKVIFAVEIWHLSSLSAMLSFFLSLFID